MIFLLFARVFDLQWSWLLSRYEIHYWGTLITRYYKYFQNDNIDKFALIQYPFNARRRLSYWVVLRQYVENKIYQHGINWIFYQEKDEYRLLSGKAHRFLIPLATSSLYECGFSAVAVIKSKYCAKINMEYEMRWLQWRPGKFLWPS